MGELFDVLEIVRPDGDGAADAACFLDAPQEGRACDAGAVELVGWIIGPGSAPVAVEVVRDGAVIAREPLGMMRPDVAAAYPDASCSGRDGFRAIVTTAPGPPGVELEVRGVLADGRRVPVAVLRGRRRWRRPTVPTVAVVLYARDGRDLVETLATVRAQSHRDLEVVVVGCEAREAAAVRDRFPEVRPVATRSRSPAAAWNAGIRATTGEHLLCLGPGERLLAHAVETGLRCLDEDSDAGFAAGRSRRTATNGAARAPAPHSVPRDFAEALRGFPGLGPLAATVHRRAALEEVGGFDERLLGCDAAALLLRLLRDVRPAAHDEIVAEHDPGAGGAPRAEAALASTLTALGQHAAYVRRHRRHRADYRAARARCRALYGADVGSRARGGDVRGALAGLRTLARSTSGGLGLPR